MEDITIFNEEEILEFEASIVRQHTLGQSHKYHGEQLVEHVFGNTFGIYLMMAVQGSLVHNDLRTALRIFNGKIVSLGMEEVSMDFVEREISLLKHGH